MLKSLMTVLISLVFVLPIAQGSESGPIPPKIQTPASANSVAGLELPPDQTAKPDDGFVTIKANCRGDVKWLVVGSPKYMTVPQANTIIIAIPSQAGTVITVFAIGNVDGKMTDFAHMNITVGGPAPNPGPGPGPGPGPNPGPALSKLHVTFLVDMNSVTPEVAKLLNSKTLRDGITAQGNWFRMYDIKSPIVAQKKLDTVAQKVGNNVMIVQTDDGEVKVAQAIPATEDAVFNILKGIK